jgi:oxidase EvaA
VFEFAPTVQSLEGLDANGKPIDHNPFEAYVREAKPEQFLYDALQAEEGGRFYRDDNRNCIVQADDSFSETLPENFTWMTLHQIYGFLRASNVFNIQARSLIAAIRFV